MGVSIDWQKREATLKVLELISPPDASLKIVMDPKTIMDPRRVSHLRSEKFRKAFLGADEYLDDAIEKSFPSLVPDRSSPAPTSTRASFPSRSPRPGPSARRLQGGA